MSDATTAERVMESRALSAGANVYHAQCEIPKVLERLASLYGHLAPLLDQVPAAELAPFVAEIGQFRLRMNTLRMTLAKAVPK